MLFKFHTTFPAAQYTTPGINMVSCISRDVASNLLVNSKQHITALFNDMSRVPLASPAVGLQPDCAV